MFDPVPSENPEPECALGALEYNHDIAARPAPENQELAVATRPTPKPLIFDPLALNTGQNQELIVSASPSPDPLPFDPLRTDTPVNQELIVAARPASDALQFGPHVLCPENQEPDAAAKPDLDHLVFDPLVSADAPEDQEFVATPAPEPLVISTVQHNATQSPTPRLDMRKIRAKRQRAQQSGDTAEKTRLIQQDVLMTRVAIQEKDSMIESLKNEVSGYY